MEKRDRDLLNSFFSNIDVEELRIATKVISKLDSNAIDLIKK